MTTWAEAVKKRRRNMSLASQGLLPQKVEEDSFPQTAVADREFVVAEYAHGTQEEYGPGDNDVGPSWFQRRGLAPRGQRYGRQYMQ